MGSRAPRQTRRERREHQHATTRAAILSMIRPGVAIVTRHDGGLIAALDGQVIEVPRARVAEWLSRVSSVEGVSVTSARGMAGREMPSSLRAIAGEVMS